MLMTAILRVDQYESHFQITDLTIKKNVYCGGNPTENIKRSTTQDIDNWSELSQQSHGRTLVIFWAAPNLVANRSVSTCWIAIHWAQKWTQFAHLNRTQYVLYVE